MFGACGPASTRNEPVSGAAVQDLRLIPASALSSLYYSSLCSRPQQKSLYVLRSDLPASHSMWWDLGNSPSALVFRISLIGTE